MKSRAGARRTLHMETTTIAVEKTVAEIEGVLAAHGVVAIFKSYEGGEVSGIDFSVSVRGSDISFRMPFRWEAIRKMAMAGKTGHSATARPDQARRVAARISLRWIQAQMALVDVEMAAIHEVFLPYALVDNSRTLFDVVNSGGGPVRLIAAESTRETPR